MTQRMPRNLSPLAKYLLLVLAWHSSHFYSLGSNSEPYCWRKDTNPQKTCVLSTRTVPSVPHRKADLAALCITGSHTMSSLGPIATMACLDYESRSRSPELLKDCKIIPVTSKFSKSWSLGSYAKCVREEPSAPEMVATHLSTVWSFIITHSFLCLKGFLVSEGAEIKLKYPWEKQYLKFPYRMILGIYRN